MLNKVRALRGKFRIVEPNGKIIARDWNGDPLDGGGFHTFEVAMDCSLTWEREFKKRRREDANTNNR